MKPGTVAVVTGAGSAAGIGYATARLLAGQGARLVITSTTSRINDRAGELRAAGATVTTARADLTDPAAARKAWEQLYRLVSNQAPMVPLLTGSPTVFVSARAGNYQEQPIGEPLLDQMWVR